MRMLYKIDNSANKAEIRMINVKLVRLLKFRQQTDFAQSLKESLLKFVLFDKNYEGIETGKLDSTYKRKILLDLAEIFNLKRYQRVQESMAGFEEGHLKKETVMAYEGIVLAPTCQA
jgi:hypothetical protein